MNTSTPHFQPVPQTWGTSGRNVFLYMVEVSTDGVLKVAMTTERALLCRNKAKRLLASHGQTSSDVHWRAAVQIHGVLTTGGHSLKNPDFELGVGFALLHLENSLEGRRAIRTNKKLGLEVLAGHWIYLLYQLGGGEHIARGFWASNAKIAGGIMTQSATESLVGAIVRHDLTESEAFRDIVLATGGTVALAKRFR